MLSHRRAGMPQGVSDSGRITKMVEFKLVLANPKDGKCYQREVKDNSAAPFVGMKLGDKVRGETFDLTGYEFEITGGSDNAGFPMRKDMEGSGRKKILAVEGVGLRKKGKGIRQKKTVCGNTIHEGTAQINLKVLKTGTAPLGGEEKKEEPKAEEKPKEEAKPEEKKEAPKEEKKPEEKPKEEPKAEEKKEESPAKEESPQPTEKKEEKPAEEKPAEKKEEPPKEEKKPEEKPAEKPEEEKKAE